MASDESSIVTRLRESPLVRKRVNALGPAPRAELLHVLSPPDFERADRIGGFWGESLAHIGILEKGEI